ncbi:hypothetical protein ACERJO_11725 [Halalkalibacter sp. AB-rgal2]|uniref:hypothetical protein n=1 Tax=Halalkalibacter sp. AB-rgal2 TaxID=3242695 RepID=UPI00359D12DE
MKKQMMLLFGGLSGEMKTNEVPLADGVDLEGFKKDDDDFLEVIVEIPAGPSTRGWNYTKFALQSIVEKVMRSTLAGFLGHQKPEEVKNRFVDPVTHWIGAKMEGESAFFRGVIDKDATKLKRWIRTGRVKQVSIFGYPKLTTSNGETQVTDYDALSIDWTPLDRSGMPTKIVALSGEMWDLDGKGPEFKEDKDKGGKQMEPKELLQKMKEMLGNKQLTFTMIAGEMGWKVDQIAGEMDASWLKEKTQAEKDLESVSQALGVSGEMSVVDAAKKAAEAVEENKKYSFEKAVGEMMETQIKSDAIRKDLQDDKTVIGRMWSYQRPNLKPDMTKEQLAAEMDAFMKDPVVADIVSQYHTDKSPGILGGKERNSTESSSLKTKRVSI